MGRNDITSRDVINAFVEAERMASKEKAVVTKYKQVVETMRREETAILEESQKKCSKEYVDDYLESMDEQALGKKLSSNFDNPNVMRVGKCVTESITKGKYYKALDGESAANVEVANNISNWFTSQKQIGAESVYGIAMSTSLKSLGGMAILKAPKDPKSTDLIHEIFIGMHGTNDARKDIPNFAYIYGGFKCPPPVVDPKTKEVVSLCGNSENPDVQYVIYENIAPGNSMKDMAAAIGPMEYLSAILQIALATEYGALNFGWTHFDLHDENVILRDVSGVIASRNPEKDFYIRYPIDGKEIYVRSNRVATIIDYGRSHITSNGKDYGFFVMRAGVYPDTVYPMFDVYKFLMFSVYSILQSNGRDDTLEVANALYSYFNTTQHVIDAAKEQRKAFYNLPYSDRATSLNISGFISHARRMMPDMMDNLYVTDPARLEKLEVLGCSGLSGTCSTIQGVLKGVGLDKIRPTSVLGFYEQARIFENAEELPKTRSMNSPQLTVDYMEIDKGEPIDMIYNNDIKPTDLKFKQLVDNFRPLYPEAIVRHANELQTLLDEFRMGRESAEVNVVGINPKTVSQGTVEELISIESYEIVRAYLTQLSLFRTVAQKIASYLNSGAYITKVYRDEVNYKEFLELQLEYSSHFKQIKLLYVNGKNVAKEFVRVARTTRGKSIIDKNRTLQWFLRDIMYTI